MRQWLLPPLAVLCCQASSCHRPTDNAPVPRPQGEQTSVFAAPQDPAQAPTQEPGQPEPTLPAPAACSPPTAGSPPAPAAGDADHSQPLQAGEGYVQVVSDWNPRGEVLLCGSVAGIDATRQPLKIVIAGTSPDQERTFSLGLPSRIPLPFVVGDVISVRIKTSVIAIHRVREATILDQAGNLLLGASQKGDAEFAPGWAFAHGALEETGLPHMSGGARRKTLGVAFSHAGRTGRSRSDQWRKLIASDGAFAVTGAAQDWTQGPRPPDASSYLMFAVVRLPAGP